MRAKDVKKWTKSHTVCSNLNTVSCKVNDNKKNKLQPHKSVILRFKMKDLKQNLPSITTVTEILGYIYFAQWQTKTSGCCLVQRKSSALFQMRPIEKV